jgi:Tfp pilus assembly protein PilF
MAMAAMLIEAALLCAGVFVAPLAAQDDETSTRALWGAPAQRSPQTVSADLLRHPISHRTRHMLERAVDWMRSGKHQEAIHQLQHTLAVDPSSAAYVHSLLGVEYMKTDQFTAAVSSFEQAVSLLPHDAINRSNYSVSLAAIGDYTRAEEQARRAQELAPESPGIQKFLNAVLGYRQVAAQRP